ncbi:hypothetical protein DAPPUDRAFT_265940 [Daphnia pulex]|uniref:Uncharacterized protein n=1 Tax=Daphnia pulex TaxID=6669 RepID=E9HU92_DAPPU|nr:hypothetical protein DAPPUDRAFT_265940 [Daphnia pulex]|eukprot:EFX64689.1 hypothetical protein DAPPUDRAFT_265940 [Daphnia pulex]
MEWSMLQFLARAPLFSRKDLQHSSRGIGSILATSVPLPLISAKHIEPYETGLLMSMQSSLFLRTMSEGGMMEDVEGSHQGNLLIEEIVFEKSTDANDIRDVENLLVGEKSTYADIHHCDVGNAPFDDRSSAGSNDIRDGNLLVSEKTADSDILHHDAGNAPLDDRSSAGSNDIRDVVKL